jgi:hypothetical protein
MIRDWLVQIVVGAVALWAGGAFLKWLLAHGDRPERESIGEVKGLEVGIFTHELRDYVCLTVEVNNLYIRPLMSPQQARVLAEWLRIAASNGRTVALARMNHRRAMESSRSPIVALANHSTVAPGRIRPQGTM